VLCLIAVGVALRADPAHALGVSVIAPANGAVLEAHTFQGRPRVSIHFRVIFDPADCETGPQGEGFARFTINGGQTRVTIEGFFGTRAQPWELTGADAAVPLRALPATLTWRVLVACLSENVDEGWIEAESSGHTVQVGRTRGPRVTITTPAEGDAVPWFPPPGTQPALVSATVESPDTTITGWCARIQEPDAPVPPPAECARPVAGSSPHRIEIDPRTLPNARDLPRSAPKRVRIWAYDADGNVGTASVAFRWLHPNVYVAGVELAQAVSPWLTFASVNPESSEPTELPWTEPVALAAGRPTQLRIYAKAAKYDTPFTTPLSATVRALRNGAEIGTLTGKGPITFDDRGALTLQHDVTSSLSPVLPAKWAKGSLDLEITINPDQALPECDDCHPHGNRVVVRNVTFHQSRKLTFYPVKIRWYGRRAGGGTVPFEPARIPAQVWDEEYEVLPLARSDLDAPGYRSVLPTIAGEPEVLRHQLWLISKLVAPAGTITFGHLPREAVEGQRPGGFTNQLALAGFCPAAPCYAADAPGRFSAAHELTHALIGGGHPPAKTPLGGLPYHDRGGGAFKILPGTHYDYMTDSLPRWASLATWKRVTRALSTGRTARAAALDTRASIQQARRRDAILVWGTAKSRRVTELQTLRAPALLDAQAATPGAPLLQITLLDRGGRVLMRRTARLERTGDSGQEAVFAIALPARRGVAEARIARNGKRLATVRATGPAPRVRIHTLRRGLALRREKALRLRWTPRAGQRRGLRYSVFYRARGGDWQPLALHQTAAAVTIPARSLPQTTALRFRVLASRALQTAVTDSPKLRVRGQDAHLPQVSERTRSRATTAGPGVRCVQTAPACPLCLGSERSWRIGRRGRCRGCCHALGRCRWRKAPDGTRGYRPVVDGNGVRRAGSGS
jgi:hypothetical protein